MEVAIIVDLILVASVIFRGCGVSVGVYVNTRDTENIQSSLQESWEDK